MCDTASHSANRKSSAYNGRSPALSINKSEPFRAGTSTAGAAATSLSLHSEFASPKETVTHMRNIGI